MSQRATMVPEQRNPSEFDDQVLRDIAQQLGGRAWVLRVVVQDQGLVLQGHCQSLHAKQLVQHAVMELTGMPVSANEIQV